MEPTTNNHVVSCSITLQADYPPNVAKLYAAIIKAKETGDNTPLQKFKAEKWTCFARQYQGRAYPYYLAFYTPSLKTVPGNPSCYSTFLTVGAPGSSVCLQINLLRGYHDLPAFHDKPHFIATGCEAHQTLAVSMAYFAKRIFGEKEGPVDVLAFGTHYSTNIELALDEIHDFSIEAVPIPFEGRDAVLLEQTAVNLRFMFDQDCTDMFSYILRAAHDMDLRDRLFGQNWSERNVMLEQLSDNFKLNKKTLREPTVAEPEMMSDRPTCLARDGIESVYDLYRVKFPYPVYAADVIEDEEELDAILVQDDPHPYATAYESEPDPPVEIAPEIPPPTSTMATIGDIPHYLWPDILEKYGWWDKYGYESLSAGYRSSIRAGTGRILAIVDTCDHAATGELHLLGFMHSFANLAISHTEEHIDIAMLAVHPNFRRRGYAQALIGCELARSTKGKMLPTRVNAHMRSDAFEAMGLFQNKYNFEKQSPFYFPNIKLFDPETQTTIFHKLIKPDYKSPYPHPDPAFWTTFPGKLSATGPKK